MFELWGLLFKFFVFAWIAIIAIVPQIIMGGLVMCILATLMTYLPIYKPLSRTGFFDQLRGKSRS